jgi:predicted ester cyclase
MSPDELKYRARRIAQELLTQGDLAAEIEIFDPACVHHGTAGSVDTAEWISTRRRAFPDLRAIVEEEIAEGETVVQLLALAGTHRGPFLGVPPTGRRVAWPLVEVLHAGPAGTFAEHWSIWDQLDLLRQLGQT